MMDNTILDGGRVYNAQLDFHDAETAAGRRRPGMRHKALPQVKKHVLTVCPQADNGRTVAFAKLHIAPGVQQVFKGHNVWPEMFCPLRHDGSEKGRGHARLAVTGLPGLFCVSPELLPGAECRPQVAHCPCLREDAISGAVASCEATTNVNVGVGRRLIQIAGEKARKRTVIPWRAKVEPVSHIHKRLFCVCDWRGWEDSAIGSTFFSHPPSRLPSSLACPTHLS